MLYSDIKKKMMCVTLSILKDRNEEKSYCRQGDVMSPQEKKILRKLCGRQARLPFPTRRLHMRIGEPAEEYIIPEQQREEVLQQLYPFYPCPALDDWRLDLHEGKMFCVKEYRVIRDQGCNLLVSPFYPDSGGMVIDWLDGESEQAPLWVKKTVENLADDEIVKILFDDDFDQTLEIMAANNGKKKRSEK